MPNKKCVDAFGADPFDCFFETKNLIPYIESPLFVIQYEYDSWVAVNEMGISCINGNFSLENCSD